MSDAEQSNRGAEYAASINREAANRKGSRNLRPLMGLWPFIRRHPKILFAALFFLILASASTLALPWVLGKVAGAGFSIESLAQTNASFLLLLGVVVLGMVTSSIRFFFVSWIGERVVADLRDAVYRHITSLSPAFFEVTKTGEVISRLTTDTTLIQTVVGSSISIALRSTVNALGAFILMWITSPQLTLAALVVVPIVLGVVIVMGRRMRPLSRKSQDKVADTGAFASESLTAIQTVQAFTHEEADRQSFKATVEAAFQVAVRRIWVRTFFTILIGSVAGGVVTLVLWSGAQQIAQGAMTIETFTQFAGYSFVLAIGLLSMSEVWAEVQRAAGASERLMELLSVEPQIIAPEDPRPLPTPPEGRVEFRDVMFQYPTRPEISALDGYSFSAKKGETIALVGPSGAGKTTVFQLLLRFYDPQGGQVFVDGINVADAIPQDVRGRISVVQQDTVVFSGSVMENIRYGRTNASDDEVYKAAKAALADDFIVKLPAGYQTSLGERGMTLSGGQRQRLAIARALLRDAPILLLDEATSALDAESERLVQKALDEIMKGRTTLVIAHRLATVIKADRIVVMDHGQVVDMGTHEELSAKGGLYAHLADLQFSAGQEEVGGDEAGEKADVLTLY